MNPILDKLTEYLASASVTGSGDQGANIRLTQAITAVAIELKLTREAQTPTP